MIDDQKLHQFPLLKEVESQAPRAICEIAPLNASRGRLIIGRDVPPFDNADEILRAMALSHRPQGIHRHSRRRTRRHRRRDDPPPAGVWGLPPEQLKGLPGYDPDVEKSRAEARGIMERAGYGPDKRLQVKLSIRNIPIIRDPAIILIDQLKKPWCRWTGRPGRQPIAVAPELFKRLSPS